jgi:SAM-dependent methyltransferase
MLLGRVSEFHLLTDEAHYDVPYPGKRQVPDAAKPGSSSRATATNRQSTIESELAAATSAARTTPAAEDPREVEMLHDRFAATFYPEIEFGGLARCDGIIQFYSRIHTLIGPGSVVMDFGCGRGTFMDDPVVFRRQLRNFKGKVANVIGLDVDDGSASNPTVDEFRLLTAGQGWPAPDNSVDLIVSHSVLEHLPEPAHFFSEASRVLRPGGYLCITTTNLLSYVGMAGKLVPNRFHARVLARSQSARKEEDIFPTLYRCNTMRAVRRQLTKHGFRAAVYGYDGGPGYLNFSKLTYALGYLHEMMAPQAIKPILMAYGKKEGEPATK